MPITYATDTYTGVTVNQIHIYKLTRKFDTGYDTG